MSKHTKGPWRFESFGPPDGFQPFGGCGCCGSPWMNGGSTEVEGAASRCASTGYRWRAMESATDCAGLGLAAQESNLPRHQPGPALPDT